MDRKSAAQSWLFFGGIVPGITLWMATIYFGMHSACATYYHTPDIAEFQIFASSHHVGSEGKFSYLFGSSIELFLGGILWLSVRASWLDRNRMFRIKVLNTFMARTILLGLASILFMLVVHGRVQNALQATRNSGWHGAVAPNALVDNLCRVF
jgi:hypothetical protein